MFDPLYLFMQEIFQCAGLFFIIIFAWRTMFGVTGPHVVASLVKPMWRFAVKAFRWLVKHSWKLGGEVAEVIGEHAPPQYRPYVENAARVLVCLLIIAAVSALFRGW